MPVGDIPAGAQFNDATGYTVQTCTCCQVRAHCCAAGFCRYPLVGHPDMFIDGYFSKRVRAGDKPSKPDDND